MLSFNYIYVNYKIVMPFSSFTSNTSAIIFMSIIFLQVADIQQQNSGPNVLSMIHILSIYNTRIQLILSIVLKLKLQR